MILLVIFPAIIVVVASYECEGGKLTPTERKNIVTQINKYRSRLIRGKLKNKDGYLMPKGKNMLRMRWDCKLEKSAQNWANMCVFGHSPSSERRGIGENVYAYWSSGSVRDLKKTAGTDAGRLWWSELEKYYSDNPSNNLTSEVAMENILHFTQMAWGETYKLGCGVATYCDGGRTLVFICHYFPGGNMVKDLIYELGNPCKHNKDCRTKRCSAKSGLCKK
ncbi:Ancylostoma secreted protein [Dirofilaria immitis]